MIDSYVRYRNPTRARVSLEEDSPPSSTPTNASDGQQRFTVAASQVLLLQVNGAPSDVRMFKGATAPLLSRYEKTSKTSAPRRGRFLMSLTVNQPASRDSSSGLDFGGVSSTGTAETMSRSLVPRRRGVLHSDDTGHFNRNT